MHRFGLDWGRDIDPFLELYFGEGMARLQNGDRSRLAVDGRNVPLASLAKSNRSPKAEESLFYVPAQRIMSVRDGMTRPFSEYRAGDPFVLRAFSEKVHQLVQTDFAAGRLFPKANRLNETLRGPIVDHVFAGFELKTEVDKMQRRIVLQNGAGSVLPYLVWSAGQREFVPLLLGLYHLLPPAKVPRRDQLDWVVVEEPETALHPNAIITVLTVIMELRRRGYRVCLSTHSPQVLDLIWALRFIKDNDGRIDDILQLLRLNHAAPARRIAQSALDSDYRVYYFSRNGAIRDISRLDSGADDDAEREWGGLTTFSGLASDVVSAVADRRDSTMRVPFPRSDLG